MMTCQKVIAPPATALSAADNEITRILGRVEHGQGWKSTRYAELALSSHYQPIFDVENACCVAYEGLLHATDASATLIGADSVFADAATRGEVLYLDWLCRALHMRNLRNLNQPGTTLFFNAFPQASIEDPRHPEVFASTLAYYNMNPNQVVVEVIETGVADESQLVEAIAFYRSLGCRIAIDDFGTGFSNFDRLWRLKPDFVKLDRSMLHAAARDAHARVVLVNTIRLIHRCGAEVVVEGVETRDEAVIAIQAGANYLQGYLFSRPRQAAFPAALGQRLFDEIDAALVAETQQTRANDDTPRCDSELRPYLDALATASHDLVAGDSFLSSVIPLMALPRAVRAYLVTTKLAAGTAHEERGRHVVDLVEDHDLSSLVLPNSAISQLNHMLARAVTELGVTQVSFPTATPDPATVAAQSLSHAFMLRGEIMVLGCDVLLAPHPAKRSGSARRDDADAGIHPQPLLRA